MEIVYQKEIKKDGNDCRIYNLYMIMEWRGKYIVSLYTRVCGWHDDANNFVYPQQFDTLEEAHDEMVKLKQANGDYEG